MDRLDLRLVEYFVAVAEELHFGRAAARLHIAQPSLSQQIRKLEDQLGARLLDRSSRRVELTPAGAALLDEGRLALAQAERAVRAVRQAGATELTVGFYGSSASLLLADVLRTFTERMPAVAVAVREIELSHIDDLTSERVDVAFTRLQPGEADLDIEVLMRQPRVVALPAAHPLSGRDSISFADLRAESFITGPRTHNPAWREQWLAEQRAHGLPGRVVAEAATVQEILTLVSAGRGVCLVPAPAADLYPHPDVAYVAVRDAEPATVSVAWPRRRMTPVVAAFVEAARDVARAAA
jgi:DNA-binding transcriptional LysR family regulator